MLRRQRTGSVVCRSCGRLVGVNDERCYNCGALYPALWGWAPVLRRMGGDDMGFVTLTIGGCTILYMVSLIVSALLVPGWSPFSGGIFGFLGPAGASLRLLGSSGYVPVWKGGQWWTLLSAGWLHGGILHIFFNMYWVRRLAPPVAQLYGPGRMVILYTVSSVIGFVFSSYGLLLVSLVMPIGVTQLVANVMGGAGYTVGASAALMGLLGTLIHYGRRGGQSTISEWAWGYVILFGVFGLVLGGIDNWAHLGGFLGGWLGARILDPLKPERLDHLVGALVCLVATLLAIIASVVTGLSWGG